jgi:FKBP-type peptidyl-prolyl cis-trans isomerase (trigger factor)
MKTPMQELIDEMTYMLTEGERSIYALREKARKLLEKEKEVIIETSKNSYIAGYLDNQAKVDDSMNFPEEYYTKTFNTKER